MGPISRCRILEECFPERIMTAVVLGLSCRFHLVMILWHCADLELVLEELEMSFSWRDGMTENKFLYHFLYHMTRVAVDGQNVKKKKK